MNLTITIPATEDKSTGIFIVPDMFTVTDDDINEIEQSFALVAQLGSDVPDSFTCFQRIFGNVECFGRTGVTEIKIMDNDGMLLKLLWLVYIHYLIHSGRYDYWIQSEKPESGREECSTHA